VTTTIRAMVLLVFAGIITALDVQGADMSRSSLPLIDFAHEDEAARWGAVNDGVMGGRSAGRLRGFTDSTAAFEGDLSLENNGGFASVRRSLPPDALAGSAGVVLAVRGDGRPYQFRARMSDGLDGVAYRARFDTVDGAWQEVVIRFADCRPTFRGRSVRGAPPLDPARIAQIGLLIADGLEGAFRLEVRSIRALDGSASPEARP